MFDKNRTASFDIDAQKSFTSACADELPVPEGHKIVNELKSNAKHAKYRIGSKDAHCEEAWWITKQKSMVGNKTLYEFAPHFWPKHCIVGTKGFQLLEGLPRPIDYDFFVWKGVEPDVHPYGACYHDPQEKRSTGVIEWMKSKGITHVICGGLALDYCVAATAIQLKKAEFEVCVNLAACRGIDKSTVKKAMANFARLGIVVVDDSKCLG
jgi:nicotinamidase/pyrazinamidase